MDNNNGINLINKTINDNLINISLINNATMNQNILDDTKNKL